MLISREFRPFVIKRYRWWAVILHENQSCLGRVTIWWIDRTPGEGEILATETIPPEAWTELQQICGDVKRAWGKLGHRTHLSPAEGFIDSLMCLRNLLHLHNGHLHYHYIPRFKEPVSNPILKLTFEDPEWGKGYKGLPNRELGPIEQRAVMQLMALALC